MTNSLFEIPENAFPAKKESIFLAHCSVSPLYAGAAEAMIEFVGSMSAGGITSLSKYFHLLPEFHDNVGAFLKTLPENISYVHNTAEALSMIANGYPFEEGDEVISYIHEYPSNHYPWVLQQKRGVKLVLLSDTAPNSHCEKVCGPKGWSMDELEQKITARTRIVALSHVQFTSGYAADLHRLGRICRKNSIDLIVDCAQSLGCLPVFPEDFGAAAIVSSGWKWLMGPKGSALLYTSGGLREKLVETMAGPGLMRQGLNYLDHSWSPHRDGRKFEYSTLPWDHIAAMNVLLKEVFLRYSIEDIRNEVFRLQDLLLSQIKVDNLHFLKFSPENRSGILAAEPAGNSRAMVDALAQKGVIVTAPIGYLRFAPHFYNDENQIAETSRFINELELQ